MRKPSPSRRFLIIGFLAATNLSVLVPAFAQDGNPRQPSDADWRRMSIVEALNRSDDCKVFAKLLQATPLATTLLKEGACTVFVPTDAAIQRLPKGTVEGWLKPENLAVLERFVKYHVIEKHELALRAGGLGDAVSAALAISMTTDQAGRVSGVTLITGHKLTEHAGSFRVNDAKVTHANLNCKNGVVHKIDQVLEVPDQPVSPNWESGMTVTWTGDEPSVSFTPALKDVRRKSGELFAVVIFLAPENGEALNDQIAGFVASQLTIGSKDGSAMDYIALRQPRGYRFVARKVKGAVIQNGKPVKIALHGPPVDLSGLPGAADMPGPIDWTALGKRVKISGAVGIFKKAKLEKGAKPGQDSFEFVRFVTPVETAIVQRGQ